MNCTMNEQSNKLLFFILMKKTTRHFNFFFIEYTTISLPLKKRFFKFQFEYSREMRSCCTGCNNFLIKLELKNTHYIGMTWKILFRSSISNLAMW